MWSRLYWFATVATLVACPAAKPKDTRPLKEAIVGAWDVWCATDDEAKASCRDRDTATLVKTFKADGTIEVSVDGHSDRATTGKWNVNGSELELAFEGASVEHSRARIEDDRLVLWYPRGAFGSVLARHGQMTARGAQTGTIGGVRYAIDLPAGFRLASNDSQRQRWLPADGGGFALDLVVEPRPHVTVDGHVETAPCPGSSITSRKSTADVVERDIAVGLDVCLPSTTDWLMCSVGHSRGYLEPSEKRAALALCKSLVLR